MSFFLKNIIRIFCLILAMNVFACSVQANDSGDDDDASFELELGATSINQTEYTDALPIQAHQQKQTHMFPEHSHNKKFQAGKHISVQLFISFDEAQQFPYTYTAIIHTPALSPSYSYLYFREINPPPPKA